MMTGEKGGGRGGGKGYPVKRFVPKLSAAEVSAMHNHTTHICMAPRIDGKSFWVWCWHWRPSCIFEYLQRIASLDVFGGMAVQQASKRVIIATTTVSTTTTTTTTMTTTMTTTTTTC